jgi:hypothetical protein
MEFILSLDLLAPASFIQIFLAAEIWPYQSPGEYLFISKTIISSKA